MPGPLTLSMKELERLQVMTRLAERCLTRRRAAALLRLSERQVRRLYRAFVQDGAAGLVSRRRGRPSARRLPVATRERALTLIRARYADFGPTFAHQKLTEEHALVLSVETLRRQIVESRTLLGDRLRLYQIHSATIESGVLDDGRVLDELGRLKSEGLAIGLTVTGPGQANVIRRALDVNTRRANLFQVVQATWNLLEPSAGPALADAKASGLGVIIKEAVANGRLTERDTSVEVSRLKQYADAHRTSPDVVAIAAALSNSWVDVVLSGAVTPEQLASNLRAVDLAQAAGDWPEIAESPNEYWSRRSTLAWL